MKEWELREQASKVLGGPGSGFHGHVGRPGKRGGSMAGRGGAPMGDGRHEKSTHRKLAKSLASSVGGARIKAARGGYEATVSSKGSIKRKAVDKWLDSNGFELFKDPMKTEYFRKEDRGTSRSNGRFLVETTTTGSGSDTYTSASIIDMKISGTSLWAGKGAEGPLGGYD